MRHSLTVCAQNYLWMIYMDTDLESDCIQPDHGRPKPSKLKACLAYALKMTQWIHEMPLSYIF